MDFAILWRFLAKLLKIIECEVIIFIEIYIANNSLQSFGLEFSLDIMTS